MMKRSVALTLWLITLFVLAGCYYHGKAYTGGPFPREYISIITNLVPDEYPLKKSACDTTGVYVLSVDGKKVPTYLQNGRVIQEIEMYPGKHTIEVSMDCAIHDVGDYCTRRKMTVQIEVLPGRTYLLDARADRYSNTWKPVLIDLKEAGIRARTFISS
ncbi:hypothetical protein [Thermodesulforhabdus norvegica]|uniref:DUF2846 domain-containing protein n=1 Tax=Thermodesulforhabdus norvegica TaxID=39841 RepID=A0A1I4RF32_9BACT|nr:hypothetical protein [Thermodesulforhabdus norvegica]SFM50871.1 hypothetical protein SAMN05660836_00585 [Thermodesulforhabdus norvegica]